MSHRTVKWKTGGVDGIDSIAPFLVKSNTPLRLATNLDLFPFDFYRKNKENLIKQQSFPYINIFT